MTNETQIPSAAEQAAAASKPAGTAAKKAAKKPSKVTITKPAAKKAKPAAKKAKPAAKKAKPAAKKAKPASTGDRRLVPADLETYTKDSEHKTAGGNVSIHCNDPTAQKLLGKSLDQRYSTVAKAIKEEEKALRAKYKHLNVGMQRMCLGNRMRGASVTH